MTTPHEPDDVPVDKPVDPQADQNEGLPTNITINVVQPPRSTGFFTSCLQGCGCAVVLLLILAACGSFIR